MRSPLFDKVVLVGVGLMGSSLGMNLVARSLAREVVGVGRQRRNLKEALRRKAIHRAVPAAQAKALFRSLTSRDLVVLALPVRGILAYLKILSGPCLVTDVGSTKSTILRMAEARGLRFVGGHPIAGTERSGAAAGEMDLYQNRTVLIVPAKQARPGDVQRIMRLWKLCGSRVLRMDGREHDRLLAVVSHLPHVAAYALAKTLRDSLPLATIWKFFFTSLRDTTRVAASPEDMWSDIFLENRAALLPLIRRLEKNIQSLRQAMEARQTVSLRAFLARARDFRRKLESGR